MSDNKFNDKSYNKSKTMRALIRSEMFEKNRQTNLLSYLNDYDAETRQTIINSIQGPIPTVLLPANQAVRSTISYYRRSGKPVFKTRLDPMGPLDPHMTYESLWSLAAIKNKTQFPNIEQVTKEFEEHLKIYLQMPYHQIREAAAIAAGNQIIGKPQDILQIVQENQSNLWIMINHIYERKIDFKELFKYVPKNIQIVYKSIYEITNNYKDQIIYSIINNEEIVSTIIDGFGSKNPQIQEYAIRIIGNILAEAEDYAGDLTKYQILDRLYPLLSNQKPQVRRDGCWLLANYAFQSAAANQILCKQNIMERLIMLFRNQDKNNVKFQIYYILSHLAMYGDKTTMYKLASSENFLEQCSYDLDIEDQDLVHIILNLIQKIVSIGEQFMDYEQQQQINPFSQYIKSTNLKSQIASKSFSQNPQISNLSLAILDKISTGDDLGMI